MNQHKRAFKLADFTAHSSNVCCISIGRKTFRIVATGGEDKKVNLWTLNKPTCIMSLSGHTSAVQSLSFSPNEDKIASGALSGSLRIWDLELNRLICNLVGHKSSVTCSEFHTFSEYLASGSVDSNIRLWDLRRKGCIFTYKGHTGTINALKFSPDSKWIASASDDNTIKIWDLKAGRLLTDLKSHTNSVNTLEFHPNEFLLASGSNDKTVKFWDLEKMEIVSTSSLTANPIKAITFDSNGQCLIAVSNEYVHTFSWEPSKLYDAYHSPWKQVNDVVFANNKLIVASASQSNAGFYAVDLTQFAPFGVPPSGSNTNINNIPINQQPQSTPQPQVKPLSSSTRKNFSHHQQIEKPEQQNDIENSIPQSLNSENDDDSKGSICNLDEYNKIFRPKNEIKRFVGPGVNANSVHQSVSNPILSNNNPSHANNKNNNINNNNNNNNNNKRGGSPPSQSTPTALSRPNFFPQQPQQQQQQQQQQLKSPFGDKIPTPTNLVVQSVPSKELLNQKLNNEEKVKINDNNQFGVNMNDFLPKAENEAKLDALDLVSTIDLGHDAVMKAIRIRLRNIQNIRSIWTNGNIKLALDTAVSMDDITVMADILNQINQTASVWTLDICTLLLPSIKKLIDSKYEEHIQVGCDSTKIILKNFGKLIKANILPPSSVGVDISREERQRKCTHCFDYLTAIILTIDKKSQTSQTSQKILTCFREINLLMKTLD